MPAALWVPVRRGEEEWLVNMSAALAIQPLDGGRVRIMFDRWYLECDEAWYNFKMLIASRLEP